MSYYRVVSVDLLILLLQTKFMSESQKSRTRPNYFYSVISVTLVLLLLGVFGLIMLHAQKLIEAMKERMDILIEMNEDTSQEQIAEVKAMLEESAFVKPNSIKYISKEVAVNELFEEFGNDFEELDFANPLYDVFTFNVISEYLDADSLLQIRESLIEHATIYDVYYQESFIDKIASNINRIGLISLAVGVFMLFVAAVLIHNTIRLAMYANRFIIKNMQLVGATWEFISKPYIRRAVILGLVSGLLAVGILIAIVFWLQSQLPELKEIQNWLWFSLLFLGLIGLGILVNFISTYFVVKRYLKMRVDDLY